MQYDRRVRRCVVLAIALSSAIAIADDDLKDLPQAVQDQAAKLTPEARPHFAAGYRAFAAKHYNTASAEFELAYKSSPEVPLLYTWAQSERLGHDCTKAIKLYEKYLYADINQEQAEYARRWIRECEAELRATKPALGSASDGSGAGIGSDTSVPVATTYTFYTDYTGDALTVGGVIGLVIGAVYFSKASSDADASDSTKHTDLTLEMYNQLHDAAIHERNVGIGATIVGGVLAAAGVGVYIYHWKTFAPVTVTTDGRTVSLATKF